MEYGHVKKMQSAESECIPQREQEELTVMPNLCSLSHVGSLSRTSSHKTKLNLGTAPENQISLDHNTLGARVRIVFHADLVVKPLLRLGFHISLSGMEGLRFGPEGMREERWCKMR